MIEAKGMIAPRYLANLMSHYLIIKGTMFLNGRSDRLYAEMIVLTGTNYSMQAHYYKNLINNSINNLSYIIKKRRKETLFHFLEDSLHSIYFFINSYFYLIFYFSARTIEFSFNRIFWRSRFYCFFRRI